MNNLTSFQRKLVYITGILILLIPITWLGMPPEPGADNRVKPGSGGKLSQLRQSEELGETSLGNVDPTSSTMNLLLLGFRGIATSSLWMEAQDQQKRKEWAELDSTIKSIVLLQPHFLKVWHFQGWNLAYNVSAEWDAVADRYYWVKRGVKFYIEGKDRNEKFPELYWFTGDTLGKKIGRADEWKEFRQFFRSDPDKEQYPNGIDPDVKQYGKEDNYLEAREWFLKANEVVQTYKNRQHIMAEPLFRFYPARALIDYAMALQREGKFGEESRASWEDAFHEWAEVYGRQEFECPIGTIHMELQEDEVAEWQAKDAEEPQEVRRYLNWVARYQDMCNYRYWRSRCKIEGERDMADAHRDLFDGEEAYRKADFDTAIETYKRGLTKYEAMLKLYPDLKDDDNTIEEIMVAQLFWRDCLRIVEGAEPSDDEDFPLKDVWISHQNRKPQMVEEFQRRQRR
ncbi:MAG: hypothetical protein NT069_03975 [Planctomycetota bacterium]|nr:hypothetical protein [Planctomycetota bacterium]